MQAIDVGLVGRTLARQELTKNEQPRSKLRGIKSESSRIIRCKRRGNIANNDKEILVRINESTYIPAGHKHRLANPWLTNDRGAERRITLCVLMIYMRSDKPPQSTYCGHLMNNYIFNR